MMQWFWYWLGCKLQKRREDRVAIADHMADRVLIGADPDYARATCSATLTGQHPDWMPETVEPNE